MADKKLASAKFIPNEEDAVGPKKGPSEKETVLMVDDSNTFRSLLKEILEAANFNVLQAEDGQKALDIFPATHIDAILLDIEMPGLDGFQTCQKLRALPNGKTVPIIMLTALDDEDSMKKSYEVGATDFIAKSLDWDLIVHQLRYAIRFNKQ